MSINFFEAVFKETILDVSGDTQVCCPFPHKTTSGTIYREERPSAGVNLAKNVFHCFSCGRSYSETSFCAAYLGISYSNAVKFLKHFHKSKPLKSWKDQEERMDDENAIEILKNLKVSPQIVKQLHIGYKGAGKEISIPIIMFDRIMDIVTYRPGQKPKYKRELGSMSGLICPFDAWIREPKDRNTIICAGEKDMIKARTLGFNAISFTGGEQNIPKLFLELFNNRNVYIIYDNDEAGKNGSKKLATALKHNGANPYIVDISETCKEQGEDLYDFFSKYNKSKTDLIEIMQNTQPFTEEDYKKQLNIEIPLVELNQATKETNINRLLRSDIQVIATVDATFLAPNVITATKTKVEDDEDAKMEPGQQRVWYLNEDNYKDLFYLIDSNLKEKAIESYIRTDLLKVPKKEKGVNITKEDKMIIYKAFVTDCLNDTSDAKPIEFLAYSLGKKLENGNKYTVTYKLVPHPQDGQKLIMVISDVEETDSFMNNFIINDSVKAILDKFKDNGNFEEKFNDLINKTKGIVKADYDETLLAVIDLWYHTVLQFNVGAIKNIRGYLDTIIIGESRIGKSSTVNALRDIYQLGKIVSLAGSSATMAGLIGGSDKVGGSYRTRAGLIPQNNKGAIVFEELIKCKNDILKELTDIRSSNKVRIARVNGSIELPAFVRMLTLTNSRSDGTMPKPINSYPNGISILVDIIGTAEDIARYDLLAVFGFEATKEIDPFFEPPTPYPDEYYQTRIRWIWSRKTEQTIISKEIYNYTIKKANELNKIYGSYINIFGVEAWKKILRLAIAIAGYVVSTDETYENIIVKTEHIDKAIELMVSLYDNQTFKLKEYVAQEKKYTTTTTEELNKFQEVYVNCSALIEYLVSNNNTTRTTIQSVVGEQNDVINRCLSSLNLYNFIRTEYSSIITTPKFIQAYNTIDKNIKITKEVVLKWD